MKRKQRQLSLISQATLEASASIIVQDKALHGVMQLITYLRLSDVSEKDIAETFEEVSKRLRKGEI